MRVTFDLSVIVVNHAVIILKTVCLLFGSLTIRLFVLLVFLAMSRNFMLNFRIIYWNENNVNKFEDKPGMLAQIIDLDVYY